MYLLLHTALIALTDNGNDEIHKDNVPDDQNEEPEEPCQDLEVFGAINYWRGVVVPDGLTQYNHKICSFLDSSVVIARFLDNNLGHDREASDHKKEEEEKYEKLFEYND